MMHTGGFDPPLGSFLGTTLADGGFHHGFGAPARPNTYALLSGVDNCDTNSSHSTNSSIASNQHGPTSTSPKNPKLYKTELCRSWMDHGRCNYGERCQYAHGEHEKRPIPRHPKYKTEACQSYHQTGYCPYGPRCHFIHSEEAPLKTPQQSTTKPPQPPTSLIYQPSRGQNAPYGGAKSSPLNFSFPITSGSAKSESPIPSSNDSGTESPNGSFSPGLDFDDSSSIFSNASFFGTTPRPGNAPPQKYQSTGLFDWTPSSTDFLLNDFSSFGISAWSDPSPTERLPVFQGFQNTSH
uniref:C3H1-type domain-containing protein n=1 Tax=Steinernema glaseri TaxID=37863 RepID=A0A1I7Y5K6_9BILA